MADLAEHVGGVGAELPFVTQVADRLEFGRVDQLVAGQVHDVDAEGGDEVVVLAVQPGGGEIEHQPVGEDGREIQLQAHDLGRGGVLDARGAIGEGGHLQIVVVVEEKRPVQAHPVILPLRLEAHLVAPQLLLVERRRDG